MLKRLCGQESHSWPSFQKDHRNSGRWIISASIPVGMVYCRAFLCKNGCTSTMIIAYGMIRSIFSKNSFLLVLAAPNFSFISASIICPSILLLHYFAQPCGVALSYLTTFRICLNMLSNGVLRLDFFHVFWYTIYTLTRYDNSFIDSVLVLEEMVWFPS